MEPKIRELTASPTQPQHCSDHSIDKNGQNNGKPASF
jgi:hypothetical protein